MLGPRLLTEPGSQITIGTLCGTTAIITRVHEACTWMNTKNVHNAGDRYAYWTNGNGGMFHGRCNYFKRTDGGKLWPTMDCR
ncbi:hypothetical protein VTI28DRAFT_4389 [Corynascus sepedonium]